MKKLLLISILLVMVFLVYGGMNVVQKIEGIEMVSDNNVSTHTPEVQFAKYDDCITENDFPDGYLLYTHEITNQHSGWDIEKVNESAQKYSKSLDSTLKNLSTVDAHEFIHKAFLKAKSDVENGNVSEIRKHYLGEIMRLCYNRDRLLNQNTVGIL